MPISLSEEEMVELKALIDIADCSSILDVELTYGEHLERILFDSNFSDHINPHVISDYIFQLNLVNEFYLTIGFDASPIINKIILYLEEILEEKKQQDHY